MLLKIGHKHKANNEKLIFAEKNSLFKKFVFFKNSTRKLYFDPPELYFLGY